MKRNTNLCVDLKTYLFKDVLMTPGKVYTGLLKRDGTGDDAFDEDHYSFIEKHFPTKTKRSIQLFNSDHVTTTMRADGTHCLNMKQVVITESFNVEEFIASLSNEIREAHQCLVEMNSEE